jgi:hypothetical protein
MTIKSIYKYFSDRNGYSLHELNIVIMILGIIGVVAIAIIGGQTRHFIQIFNRSSSISEGRKAINFLRTDIHNLQTDDITIMLPSQLEFTSINGNTIEYLYQNNRLFRNSNVLAVDLYSAQFSYLDIDQKITTNPTNICYIKIHLSFLKGNETVELEELIHARN